MARSRRCSSGFLVPAAIIGHLAAKNNVLKRRRLRVVLGLQSGKANQVSGAYHRYTLNYINALNYLETLRRQNEFNEFEKVR
jgi:hypothetical protein